MSRGGQSTATFSLVGQPDTPTRCTLSYLASLFLSRGATIIIIRGTRVTRAPCTAFIGPRPTDTPRSVSFPSSPPPHPRPKPRQGCLHRVAQATRAHRNLPNCVNDGGGGGVYAFLLGSLQLQAAGVVNRGSKWMFAPDTGRISVSLRS